MKGISWVEERDDSMTIMHWHNGDYESWLDGKLHSVEGPAFSRENTTQWYIKGEKMTKMEWDIHPLRLEWLKNQIQGI